MGLYGGGLYDVSSDSIPVLMVAIVANCVRYLRSLFIWLLQSVGLSRLDVVDEVGDRLVGGVSSSLAGLIILGEQLKANRVFSYCVSEKDGGGACGGGGGDGDGDGGFDTDCMVCLCKFTKGEQVRRLECRHLFHKECLDGWFDQFHWRCPLCRSPLVSDERLAATENRVTRDLITWFRMQ
ncbi:E3 ubiquitin-protein ligase RHA2A-like [Telopea speciosissima]|uniref:E3 ubiquitin-protein ligase RHA2A-like n=1 Tax=Telopea speciosissima TaxID=54955 RepID=UPI001CC8195F|nr:E3 ubiquitin-protein ligase RHA2A-like [Telopea speciosissima]